MRIAPFSLAFPLVLSGSIAAAQGSSAGDLFREGISLFSRGETAAACDRFERSYKLDAAPGTLFNVGNCHAREGRLWQAHLDFTDLAARAAAAGSPDKAALARTRLAAIDAGLPRLLLAFPAANNVETILLDDVDVPGVAWHDPVTVDLGAHTIELRADGFVTAKVAVVGKDLAPVRVDVPVLSRAADDHPPKPAVGIPPVTPGAGSAPLAEANPSARVAPPAVPVNVPRIVGYAVGGVGLVGLGVGAYFVSQAVSQHNQADSSCRNGVCANAAATTNAEHLASLSTTSGIEAGVAFGVGVVGVAAGVVLIATGHPAASAAQAVDFHLAPMFASHFSGLSLTGRF